MKLSRTKKQATARLGRKYGVVLLYAYGSRVRGDDYKKSDLDLAYFSQPRLNFNEQYRLQAALASVFGVGESMVDLVDLSIAQPPLLYFIVIEGERLYGAAKDDEALYRRALKRYIDAKPLINATEHYVQAYARV